MLAAMDGNGSLKLVDTTIIAGKERSDSRHLPHPRWLETEQVDIFADEVKNAWKMKATSKPDVQESEDEDGNENDITWLNVNETKELTSCIDTCVDRWKAAGPDSQKKMFALFAVSGIFLAVCRHGHVLVICDMIRSGELMKYPLLVVNRLIELYGPDIGLGYDIMCAFFKTLMQSQKLRDKVTKSRLVGVVPAFHGHAHNCKCQTSWHPQYMQGVGLEDFEECERTFSLSNNLASTTHLSTPFHRRQAIQEHFFFHDHDKHFASANFIYQNYCQALKRLETDVPVFERACQKLNLTPEACETFLEEEREHFNKVFEEPPNEAQTRDYAELLQKLWNAKSQSEEAHKKWKALNTTAAHRLTKKEVQRIHTRNRTTQDRYNNILEEVLTFEDDHGIVTWWTPTCKEYINAQKGLQEQKYRHALEELERLVVQWLFELTRLGESRLGYAEHDKLSRALSSRAGAIRNALDRYNKLAEKLRPPRPTLTWHSIVQMAEVADFDILKNSHIDITQLAWTKPQNRQVMQLHFGIKQAKKEITHLNVEIRHLITYMIDDHADYWNLLSEPGTGVEQFDFDAHLRRELKYRTAIHTHMAERLLQTSQLVGFTGSLLLGQRIGHPCTSTVVASLPKWAGEVLGIQQAWSEESSL
ncbi:hypothetical protein Moror_11811 [Moniliophthora roreri MCA 2997]|nr:hypothetical protein Moror_11811 [Moniliophthora roreri MCA 2997]